MTSFRTTVVAILVVLSGTLAYANVRGDARAQVEFGIKAAQDGLWREAIFRWEKAVDLDPTYAAAYNDLAIGYEHEGHPDKARQAYQKALNLDSSNDVIRQNYEMFKEINDRASRRQP
ncbi:MAG TPA: tetratricopeptide repeat protein [Vicinamibacterales bacterium]|nr:tetratricopeptide repeat protein [Vicinamibacterales bacterium]